MNDEAPRDASPAERAQEELLQLKNRAVAKALFGVDRAAGRDETTLGLLRRGRLAWTLRVPRWLSPVLGLLQRLGLVK